MTEPASGTRTLFVSEQAPLLLKRRSSWSIEQFQLTKKLGHGYASTVWLATCRYSGTQLAFKVYHKQRLTPLNCHQICREIKIHGALDHINIVQLWAAFEDQHAIYLLSELCAKGDVFSEIGRMGGVMSEAESVRLVLYPFLLAMNYLHGNRILHRDIKPENLLLNAAGTLKVADFGLSIDLGQERAVTRVGTLDYMAPEVVVCPDKAHPQEHKDNSKLWYDFAVDVWAAGILAYELVCGKAPFDKGNKRVTAQAIVQGDLVIPPNVTMECAHFITSALAKDPSKRPSIDQLLEHPYILAHIKAPAKKGRGLVVRAGSTRDLRPLPPNSPQSSAISHTGEVSREEGVEQGSGSSRLYGHAVSMSAADMLRFRDVQAVQTKGAAASHFGGVSAATRWTCASLRKSSLSIYSLPSAGSSAGSLTPSSPERLHSRCLSPVVSKESRAGQESAQMAVLPCTGRDLPLGPMSREELMRRLAESAGGRAALAAAAAQAGAGGGTSAGSSPPAVPQPPAAPAERSRLGSTPKRAISFYNLTGRLAVGAQDATEANDLPASSSHDHGQYGDENEGELVRVDVRRAKSFCDPHTSARHKVHPGTAAAAAGLVAGSGLLPSSHSSTVALVPTSPTLGTLRAVARSVAQGRPHSAMSHVRFAVPDEESVSVSTRALHISSTPASPTVMSHASDGAITSSPRGLSALNPMLAALPAHKGVSLTHPLLSAPISLGLKDAGGRGTPATKAGPEARLSSSTMY